MKYYLGVDLGGTNIAVGLVDENHSILSKHSVKTNCPREARFIMDDIYSAALQCLKAADVSLEELEWVGVGAPGTVNKLSGVIAYANNLGFNDLKIVEYLEDKFNKKVFVDNDANAAAYGEFIAGSAKGAKDVVAITLGTGVGSGIIIDGKIYTGFNFAAAEIGHTLIELDGRSCTCGRKGCFEAYSSATALINLTKEYMRMGEGSLMWKLCEGDLSKVSGKTAFDAMKSSDKLGKDVVEKYIYYLANGIINIINTFQPEIICVGGGISKEGDLLLDPIRRYVSQNSYTREGYPSTTIVKAELGNDAGIIGAAFLGKN